MEEKHLDPADDGEGLETLFQSSLSTLHSARSATLEQMKFERQQGQVSLTALIKAQKDLAAILKMALDMEQQIDDWNRRQTGNQGSGDADIDLDSARYEIGCRLDRLRACCHSE